MKSLLIINASSMPTVVSPFDVSRWYKDPERLTLPSLIFAYEKNKAKTYPNLQPKINTITKLN